MGYTLIEKIVLSKIDKSDIAAFDYVRLKPDINIISESYTDSLIQELSIKKSAKLSFENVFFSYRESSKLSSADNLVKYSILKLFANQNNVKLINLEKGKEFQQLFELGKLECTKVYTILGKGGFSGAFGSLDLNLDKKEMISVISKGSLMFKVPESIKIGFYGNNKNEIRPSDILYHLQAKFGKSHFKDISLELYGDFLNNSSFEYRACLCELLKELGLRNVFLGVNNGSRKIVENRTNNSTQVICADVDAQYKSTHIINIADIQAKFKLLHIEKVLNFKEVYLNRRNKKFELVCNNLRLEQLKYFISLIRNKLIPTNLKLCLAVASKEIWVNSLKLGLICEFKEAGINIAINMTNHDYDNVLNISDFSCKKNKISLSSSPEHLFNYALGLYHKTSISLKSKLISLSEFIINSGGKEFYSGKAIYMPMDDVGTGKVFKGKLNLYKDLFNLNVQEIKSKDCNTELERIIISHRNFGCGLSNEISIKNLINKGVSLVIAISFDREFKLNARAMGLKLVECKHVMNLNIDSLKDNIEADLRLNHIVNRTKNIKVKSKAF
ncbi:MAG: aconitase family protein [Marinifilaceae bacterium]|jgi:3-isopropylmalate/(R)-2-methylmalate dehydratase large subunit|nr:aconitase family protein [Marinifilaceae bacterium]